MYLLDLVTRIYEVFVTTGLWPSLSIVSFSFFNQTWHTYHHFGIIGNSNIFHFLKGEGICKWALLKVYFSKPHGQLHPNVAHSTLGWRGESLFRWQSWTLLGEFIVKLQRTFLYQTFLNFYWLQRNMNWQKSDMSEGIKCIKTSKYPVTESQM